LINSLASIGLKYEDGEIVLENPNDPRAMPIGIAGAATKIPKVVKTESGLVLVDLPGLNEDGGVQDLINTAYISHVFRLASSLRFILTVPESNITEGDRGYLFKNFLSRMKAAFGDKYQQVSEKSSILVVTKSRKEAVGEAHTYLFDTKCPSVKDEVIVWSNQERFFHVKDPIFNGGRILNEERVPVLQALEMLDGFHSADTNAGGFFKKELEEALKGVFQGVMESVLKKYTQDHTLDALLPERYDELVDALSDTLSYSSNVLDRTYDIFNVWTERLKTLETFWPIFEADLNESPVIKLFRPMHDVLFKATLETYKIQNAALIKRTAETLPAKKELFNRLVPLARNKLKERREREEKELRKIREREERKRLDKLLLGYEKSLDKRNYEAVLEWEAKSAEEKREGMREYREMQRYLAVQRENSRSSYPNGNNRNTLYSSADPDNGKVQCSIQ